MALRSHYGFDSFFCLPGAEGAHEKGGVEGEIAGGRFRRRHLVPVPTVADLDALNDLIARGDAADDDRRIEGRAFTVGEHFAAEAPHLAPLAVEPFEAVADLGVRVDHKACICVRQSFYCQDRVRSSSSKSAEKLWINETGRTFVDNMTVVAWPRA